MKTTNHSFHPEKIMEPIKTREEMVEKIFPKSGFGAELGVFEGAFSQIILEKAAPQKLYLVDLFKGNVYSADKNNENGKTINLDKMFIDLQKRYENDQTVSLLQISTLDFLQNIDDGLLDFVYIDADHSYNAVIKDLNLSIRKVKQGGIIAGHDYCNISHFGVFKAVNEFATKNNLKLQFTSDDKLSSYYMVNDSIFLDNSNNSFKKETNETCIKNNPPPQIKPNGFKFLFKYPTRERPDFFKRCIESWYSLLSKECNFQFVLTIDKDDETMNNDEMKQYINQFDNLTCYIGNSKTKIEAINANIPKDNWDIIVLISDDMIPQVKDYDIEIEQAFKEYFPNLDGLIYFFDGERIDLCTLTIMGKKLYDSFGYIYHPSYKSLWSDNEQTDVCQTLGKYKFIKKCIIKHEFTQNTKKGLWTSMDGLYRRNYIYFDCDHHNYNLRKKNGFPK